jgi:rod shape-determining protein MreC
MFGHTMLGLFKKYPGISTLLALQLVAFLLVSYQIQVNPRLTLLEQMGLTLIGPFQSMNHRLIETVSETFEQRKAREDLERENLLLRRNLEQARARETALREAAMENDRLRTLLQLEPRQDYDRVFADVIGHVQSRKDYMIIVNKGLVHGLQAEQGVYSPSGVVGVIWEVSSYYSKIMTLNNPSSAVAAMVQQSRYQQCFVKGTGRSNGLLENFPNYEQIRYGDMVLTSGLDGIFPKGIHIGSVIHAQTSSYMAQEVELKFATDFARLEEVIVLIPHTANEETQVEIVIPEQEAAKVGDNESN